MRNLPYFIFLSTLIFITSCTDVQQRNKEQIIGNWMLKRTVHKPNENGVVLAPPFSIASGFTFFNNDTYENKKGFYSFKDEKLFYLGNISKYHIKADSLILFTPANEKQTLKIFKLTTDSMIIGNEFEKNIFARYKADISPLKFERIVLSSSGCFGTCPIMNISIDSSGLVLFDGALYTTRTGLYTSKISKKEFNQLLNNFRIANFDSLKSECTSPVSDGQTITTTFIKDGKIYKTVNDYRLSAQEEFTWAYTPLSYLYQKLKLRKLDIPDHLKSISLAIRSAFKRNDSILDVKKSETFLLFDYLRKGMIVNKSFDPKYHYIASFQINDMKSFAVETDGRYYTFTPEIKGNAITIDIGFNYLTNDLKRTKWRKADEYD